MTFDRRATTQQPTRQSGIAAAMFSRRNIPRPVPVKKEEKEEEEFKVRPVAASQWSGQVIKKEEPEFKVKAEAPAKRDIKLNFDEPLPPRTYTGILAPTASLDIPYAILQVGWFDLSARGFHSNISPDFRITARATSTWCHGVSCSSIPSRAT